jgi:hypothetical protein
MTKIILSSILILSFVTLAFQDAVARGRGSSRSGRSSSIGPGTGSNTHSHSVRGYSRKDGTYIAPHRQSNPDKNFSNNWSTNPNTNPYNGKQGTRINPPSK